MKKYMLSSMVCVSATTIVEAKAEAEAIEIAERRDVVIDILHGNYKSLICGNWVISGADGDPQEIEVDGEMEVK